MAGPIYRVTYCFENLFGGKLRLKWTNRKGEGGGANVQSAQLRDRVCPFTHSFGKILGGNLWANIAACMGRSGARRGLPFCEHTRSARCAGKPCAVPTPWLTISAPTEVTRPCSGMRAIGRHSANPAMTPASSG
nr:MAG TPA: hypothetical protein [Caudoviricetes sp.]